jgi:hypothetical protein
MSYKRLDSSADSMRSSQKISIKSIIYDQAGGADGGLSKTCVQSDALGWPHHALCVSSHTVNESRAFSAALYCGQFVVWYRLRGVFVFIPPVSHGLSDWLNYLCNKADWQQKWDLRVFLSEKLLQVSCEDSVKAHDQGLSHSTHPSWNHDFLGQE